MSVMIDRKLWTASTTRLLGCVVAVLMFTLFASADSAFGVESQPRLRIFESTFPTHAAAGRTVTLYVTVENTGAAATSGAVTVTTELPNGVTAISAGDGFTWDCPGAAGATTVTCTLLVGETQTFTPDIPPHGTAPRLVLEAAIDAGGTTGGASVATVSGGGSADDSASTPITVSSDPVPFGIAGFGGRALNLDGSPATQAGSHPDVTTLIDFTTNPTSDGRIRPARNVRFIDVELPRGLVGNPTAVPTCPEALFNALASVLCPPESQVGVAEVTTLIGGTPSTFFNAIYNIEPPAGSPGRFSFNVNSVVINLDPTVRTGGDYGITARVSNISQTLPMVSTKVTLWGVPADPAHDGQRIVVPGIGTETGATSSAVPRPFMTLPTTCPPGRFVTRMTATPWGDDGNVQAASFDADFDGTPLTTNGCDRLGFDPGFVVRAESAAKRGAPAGIGVDLTIPQNDNPDGLASANLKQAVVTLPEGMAVNPSSADGLRACTSAEIDINGSSDPACPDASRIGTIDIVTPLLRDPLRGSIYFAAQRDNPFGTTLAIYLVAQGAGVTIKLPGRIDTNGRTVTATFDNNPQLPFEKLSLHFKTGPRAPLSLPRTCGPATTTAVLTPWSGTPPMTVQTSFDVSYDGNGAPCPAIGFTPAFSAGTINPVGGKDSPFVVGFSRTDDDQELGGVTVNMPRGLLARIASVNLCSDGQAAAGTCGDDSKIGSVTTAAGAGSNPFTLPGRVYITGPYKGAPFGLSIVVPAVAGPLNLGTVVVRAAIFVDRNTAELRIVSDPLPNELEGIPLQVRLVEVKVDRPGFTFNPTNCSASRVGGQISSLQGAIANVASRFQVGNCSALPFTPKMTLKAGAKGKLTRGKRTPLDVTLTMTRGLANNRSVQVTLPLAMNARLDVVNKRRACTQAQYDVDKCPMTVGTGTAVTPLLRDPLRGNAYFVYNDARRLPDLVIRLRGQVDFDLVGKVTITRDLRLQTTFDAVPDVPITKFRLLLASGPRNGPVGFTRNACAASTRRALRAQLAFVGQNGKRVSRTQTISVSGCGKARRATRKKK